MFNELAISVLISLCALLAIFKRESVKKNYIIIYVLSILLAALSSLEPFKILLLITTSAPLIYLLQTKPNKHKKRGFDKSSEKILVFLMVSPLFGSLFFIDNHIVKEALEKRPISIQENFYPEILLIVVTSILLISRVMKGRRN